ncbi:MAG: type II toxin-antitoxin system VapC family toxin [Terracidiphilus sp.]|jgi:predicted nucleic-acid-binding protein
MKIVVDTNVLVRAAVQDDQEQAVTARRILKEAEPAIIGRHALCEFIWVLRHTYRFHRTEIAAALRNLLNAENIVVDDAAVAAGMDAMDAGADFADGVIAYEGRWLGGETFVSFDKKAVQVVAKQGMKTKLLG